MNGIILWTNQDKRGMKSDLLQALDHGKTLRTRGVQGGQAIEVNKFCEVVILEKRRGRLRTNNIQVVDSMFF